MQGGPNAGGPDAFMTGLAGNMLRQSGENYFQRGQAFMQSKMGFMSTDSLHYYYNLNAEYGASATRILDLRCVPQPALQCALTHAPCKCSALEAADAAGAVPATMELHQGRRTGDAPPIPLGFGSFAAHPLLTLPVNTSDQCMVSPPRAQPGRGQVAARGVG